MPDLLTHVLAVYAVGTATSWRRRALAPYVPVAMVGAVLPDLAKVRLVVPAGAAEAFLGVPFAWVVIHRLGGAVALAGLGALAFRRRVRGQALGALLVGVGSGFALDALLVRANGVTPPYLYPLTWWQPPAGGLYLSSDAWPAAVAVVAAVAVWLLDHWSS